MLHSCQWYKDRSRRWCQENGRGSFHCCGKIKVLKLHTYIRQEVKTNCRTDTGTFRQLLLGLCIWLQNAWSKKAWQMFKTFYSALQKKKKKVMWLRTLSVTSDMFEEGQWCHWGISWMEWRAQVCCPNNLRTWLGLNNERVLFQNHIWKQFVSSILGLTNHYCFENTQESGICYKLTYIWSALELEDNRSVVALN